MPKFKTETIYRDGTVFIETQVPTSLIWKRTNQLLHSDREWQFHNCNDYPYCRIDVNYVVANQDEFEYYDEILDNYKYPKKLKTAFINDKGAIVIERETTIDE